MGLAMIVLSVLAEQNYVVTNTMVRQQDERFVGTLQLEVKALTMYCVWMTVYLILEVSRHRYLHLYGVHGVLANLNSALICRSFICQ